jgi:hypothetical protein
VLATGMQRGQSCCFICETADKPAIIVFARNPSDPLGKLVAQIDKAVAENKTANLRAWVTFLSDDQPALDPKVVKWGQQHAIRQVPLGVFEDAGGPPSYRISRDADVTVMLFVKQKVVVNFAYRAGELGEEQIGEIVKSVPKIVEKK